MVVWGEGNKSNHNGREIAHYGVYAQNIAKFSELQPGELLDTTLFLASGESDRSASYSFMAILDKLKESLAIKTHKHEWKDITDAPDPVAPDIQIGNVTTGEAGTDATVTRRAGSPNNAPIFDFCIPRGYTGAVGATGAPGKDGGPGPAGADGQAGKDGKDGMACRTARFVVGTSTAGWTADDCDYLCDGTDDQVEIQAAINALPTGGGEIIILDGEYNIGQPITVGTSFVSIRGSGYSTVLNVMDTSALSCAGTETSSLEGVTVNNIRISKAQECIYANASAVIYFHANNCEVHNVFSIGCGINIRNCTNIKIHHNTVIGVGGSYGVSCYYCEEVEVSDNTFKYADIFFSSCGKEIIANNFLSNSSNGSGAIHINITSSNNDDDVIVRGNFCVDCYVGIVVYVSRAIIAENCCIRGEGTAGDYGVNNYSIRVFGNNNLVIGNLTLGKPITISGTGNTAINNKDS